MRKVILIGGNPVGACQVRGAQLSQALEKYCSLNAPYILNDLFINNIDNIKEIGRAHV